MASTKNLNTYGNYKCEEKVNNKMLSYLTNPVYGEQSHHVHMFDLGSNPSKMNAVNFSHNHIDIESKLRGIKSTNMVGSNFNPILEKKQFLSDKIFNHNLKNVLLPSPFKHNSNERIGFHNI